jgi:hypothetical protein
VNFLSHGRPVHKSGGMPVLCSNISSGGASSNSAALSSAIGGRGTTARRDVMIARRGGRYAAPEESSNLIFVPVSEPPTRSSHSSKNGSTIPSIQALPQKSKKTTRPRCARAFSEHSRWRVHEAPTSGKSSIARPQAHIYLLHCRPEPARLRQSTSLRNQSRRLSHKS